MIGSNPLVVLRDDHQVVFSHESKGKILVFVLDNKNLDSKETVFIEGLNRDPINNLLWDQLSDYEKRVNVRFFSGFTTAFIESTFGMKGNTQFEKYLNALRETKDVIYLVIHKPDGSIDKNQAFNKNLTTITESDWQKSSKTPAFYLIEMKYNNSDVLDLSNPFFGSAGRAGTVRIGIKK